MKQTLIILAISLLFTSCATILNRNWINSTIYTTAPSVIVFNTDTVKTIGNKAQLKLEREKKIVEIIAITDSLEKKVLINPKSSIAFYSNIYFNYGIGMLVDRANPKRYTYPHRIYINSSDTIGRSFGHGHANNKGELLLHLSLPYINSFHLTPENEGTKTNTGFWGFTAGLDYYHSKNQFINFSVSAVTDFFVPVPAAVDISGEYELMASKYLSISNNHKIRRFSLGYGLSYSRNFWAFIYSDRFGAPPPSRDPVNKNNITLGLIFPSYFQIGENFNIGVVYRPTFYRPDLLNKFAYEHLISLDLAWKIRLKK